MVGSIQNRWYLLYYYLELETEEFEADVEGAEQAGRVREGEEIEEFKGVEEFGGVEEFEDVKEFEGAKEFEGVKEFKGVEEFGGVKEFKGVEEFEDIEKFETEETGELWNIKEIEELSWSTEWLAGIAGTEGFEGFEWTELEDFCLVFSKSEIASWQSWRLLVGSQELWFSPNPVHWTKYSRSPSSLLLLSSILSTS